MNLSDEQLHDDEEEWLPLFPELEKRPGKRQVELWALVLDARSIPCCIEATSSGQQLLVPKQSLESARSEVRLYEEKNRNWPPTLPSARALIENTLPTVSVLILLATFHNLTLLGISLPGRGFSDLHDLGIAHGAAIRDGQWWRLVTALTLHADFVHLLGNLTIGGAVIILLCRELGSGLAWCLLLGAGILGNLANVWVQSPDHRSLGASTAVFGAVGIFSAISMLRHRQRLLRGLYVPIAAGLALLALLGSEGKQTDLGAHLFGFAFGVLLGLAAELLSGGQARPGRQLNALLALLAATVVATAWWSALTLPGN
ncbi:MAG: rhomboid family intramembrane serine protease [Desulfuromonadales bacterium]|nr:rhomboid family intramembrane serine protease [Desulfuromonadales bacterium]